MADKKDEKVQEAPNGEAILALQNRILKFEESIEDLRKTLSGAGFVDKPMFEQKMAELKAELAEARAELKAERKAAVESKKEDKPDGPIGQDASTVADEYWWKKYNPLERE